MNNQLGWQEKPAQEITALDGSKSVTEFSGLNSEFGSGERQGGDTTNPAKLSTQPSDSQKIIPRKK